METHKTDTALSWLWDLPVAAILLTRLPLPALPQRAFAQPARAVWAYPLVGLILGLIVGALSWVCTAMDLSAPVTAGLILGALILLTGAMHEDGLADTADGLWGGQDATRRLEIMKDSRIGAYGVLALIVAMGLRWLGLADVTLPALVTALVLSRAMMPPLMLALPHARNTGLSHSVGAPSRGSVLLAILIGATVAIGLNGSAGVLALVMATLIATMIGLLAKTKIGGQTGDILGATQLCTEIAILIVLIP
ncbi:adenosylcobinamide-GDP ribazoletransferase [Tateyamaria pelophila]|uniref:adenosylcobinamide-GDP ribazoletransferase n=1 Tax=Tateyamaria pelophila TaxID=328415 RepID=UPI001CBAB655|nr:adenosylcobinamide-GDP ribazoletransferase [Tateyamaria pelophila]